MLNLKSRRSARFWILTWAFISAALAPAIRAQASPQLHVEVGPSQQVGILAIGVSYGEVLRALQKTTGWEIEIPALADEMKLAYARVESTQPRLALAKLLEGSRLGYAFVDGGKGTHGVKVIVIPSAPPKPSVTQNADVTSPDKALVEASLPRLGKEQANTRPSPATADSTSQQPTAHSTMPLEEAIKTMGVPPGASAADVGRAITFPISDAARIMGVPPGVAPNDVGKTIALPMSTGPGQHP